MPPDLVLHHCAKKIYKGSLEFVLELFCEMGCEVSYRIEGAMWAILNLTNAKYLI